MDNRVISFSVKSIDIEGQEDIKLLQDHALATGVKFSYLILSAIDLKNKELKLK